MHAHACEWARTLKGPIAGAAQPETVFGSPEKLVEDGVADGLSVTARWAEQFTRAVKGRTSAGAIVAAIKVVRARINTADLADVLEQSNMHGQMLGALDSRWEAEEERPVAPAEFTSRLLDSSPRFT